MQGAAFARAVRPSLADPGPEEAEICCAALAGQIANCVRKKQLTPRVLNTRWWLTA